MKCLACGWREYEHSTLSPAWGCFNCTDRLSDAAYKKIEAMQAVIDLCIQVGGATHLATWARGVGRENLGTAYEAAMKGRRDAIDNLVGACIILNKENETALDRNCHSPQPCGHDGCKRCEGEKQ
jgi:hypothetical protein